MKSTLVKTLSLSVLAIACSSEERSSPRQANHGNSLQARGEDTQAAVSKKTGDASQDIAEHKARLDEALAKIEQLKKERDEAVATHLVSTQQVQELQSKLDEAEKAAQAALEALQAKLNAADAQIASLTQQLRDATAKGDSNAAQIGELQAKLDEAQNSARAAIDKLQAQLNEANAEVVKLTQQLKEAIEKATISDQKVQQAVEQQAILEAALKAAREAQEALQQELIKANEKIADLNRQLNDAVAQGSQNVQQIQQKLDVAQQETLKIMDALKTKDSTLFRESLIKAKGSVDSAKVVLDEKIKAVATKGDEIRKLSETIRVARVMTLKIEGCQDADCQQVGLRDLAKIAEEKAFSAHITYTNSVMRVTLLAKIEADLIEKYGKDDEQNKTKQSSKATAELERAAKDTAAAKAARDAAYKDWMELDTACRQAKMSLDFAIAERRTFMDENKLVQVGVDLIAMEQQRNALLLSQHDAEEAYQKAVANVTSIQAVIEMIDQAAARQDIGQKTL